MTPGSFVQAAFGAGIFRGRRAPPDSVYDAVNALVNDEGELFRRGGAAYKSTTNTTNVLMGLWDVFTAGGRRTLFYSPTDLKLYALSADDATPVSPTILAGMPRWSRVVVGGGFVVFRVEGGTVVELYGGSLKTADYSTGTVTTTAGSRTVTGVGTSWLANVDTGMIFAATGGGGQESLVAEVVSNTSLRLREPFLTSLAGVTYSLARRTQSQGLFALDDTPALSAVANAARRIIACQANRAYFSPVDDPTGLNVSDYHELPSDAQIVGADGIGDTAILFSTRGVWTIANMALDPIDDLGNVQHQVAQVNNLMLWGDSGIVGYEGALIVPAIDDVYAMPLDGPPVALSKAIRPLYREYVEAGYRPGQAVVYRGHYFLPVLNSLNTLIDTLVCRLDRDAAWTRLDDQAAGGAYAVRMGADVREPKLLGIKTLRVTDLTGIFDPDATRKADADGTSHSLTVISNDVDTGPGLRGNTVLSANVEYELVDAASDNPVAAFATAAGAEGSSFTTATALATGLSSGPESDGTAPVAFDVRRKAERLRWRFLTSGAAASAILRRVELKIRQSGRQ